MLSSDSDGGGEGGPDCGDCDTGPSNTQFSGLSYHIDMYPERYMVCEDDHMKKVESRK